MRAKVGTFEHQVSVLAQQLKLPVKRTWKILRAVFEQVSFNATRGHAVRIPHFGTFLVRTRKGRKVRHPQTKELMHLPATKVLSFRPAQKQRGLR